MSVEQTSRDLGQIGETDPERDEAGQAGTGGGDAPGGRDESPYRGLNAYEEADERWFFGREDITELIAFLAEQRSELPLMLVGAAGSGKSSLLRAGLLPRLRAAAGAAAPLEPPTAGGERVELLDLAVTGVAAAATQVAQAVRAAEAATPAGAWGTAGAIGAWGGADGTPAALLVDQFEAAYAPEAGDADRTALVAGLCELARGTLVVIALRAECYGQALANPVLRRALQERNVLLGPMSAGQVRRAVVEPARLAGLDVDDALADAVLADLAADEPAARAAEPADRPDLEWEDSAPGTAVATIAPDADGQAHEPGALPLLSYALLATWRRADGGPVTVSAYRASGGVAGALPGAAERAYESLSHGQRKLARRLLPRLVELADGQPPRPVSVPLNNLKEGGTGGRNADVARVLGAFAGERLITLADGQARFTHDIVLTAWPRLRDWITEDVRGPQARPADQAGPRAEGTPDGDTAPGSDGSPGKQRRPPRRQRRQAAASAATPADAVTTASLVAPATTATPASPVAPVSVPGAGPAAGPGRERHRVRRLRGVVAVLVVLFLAAGGLAGYAFAQRQSAVSAEHAATAGGQAADSRAVAFVADHKRSADPAVAAQLAAAAYEISPTPQATASLLDAAAAPSVARIVDSAGSVRRVSVSPDGRLLVAAGADGSLRLWNIAAPGHPVAAGTMPGTDQVNAVTFSPDGAVLATAGPHGVQLWQVAGGTGTSQVSALGQALTSSAVGSVAFSPDGKTLVAGGAGDGTVRLWNLSDPAHPVEGKPLTVAGAGAQVTTVAFGAGVLAAGTSGGTVTLWAVTGTNAPVRFHSLLSLAGGTVSAVAFSPNGKTLAAAGAGAQAGLWTVQTGTGKKHNGTAAVPDGALAGLTHGATGIAFSTDGASLAAANPGTPTGAGASVLVWSLATRMLTATVPQPQPVTSVAWDGAARVAASTAGGTVALIALPAPGLFASNSPASVAYDPDGTTVAVSGTSVELWDAGQRTLLAGHPLPAGTTVNATAFTSVAGQPVVAVALSDGTVALLDGSKLTALGKPFPVTGAKGAATSVAFSRDGKQLVTGSANGDVRLFDVSNPARPGRLAAGQAPGGSVAAVAVAANGTTIATAGPGGAVQLWQAGHPAGGGPLALTAAGPALAGVSGDVSALAFSPDGASLAAGAGKTVHRWDVTRPGNPVALGAPLTGPSGPVLSVAFNPAGTTLAAGTADGSTWLWHVTGGQPALVANLAGAGGRVSAVTFSPSGGQLAAANGGGVHLWNTDPATALSGICANLGQPLTPSEWAGSVPGTAYHQPCQAG